MEDRLVTIAEYSTAFEAELAKVRLENEGIEAGIVGEDLVTNMYTIDAIKVELQVFEKDVEQAEAILATPPEQDLEEATDEETGLGDEEDTWEEDDDDLFEDFEDEEGGRPQ